MKSNLTEIEIEFIKKVRDYQSRTGSSLSSIGHNKAVHYTNIEKLNDLIEFEKGTITLKVAGRILKYIDNENKKNKRIQKG